MNHQSKSVRTFIGAKNFEVSRNFYMDLGHNSALVTVRRPGLVFSTAGNIAMIIVKKIKPWNRGWSKGHKCLEKIY